MASCTALFLALLAVFVEVHLQVHLIPFHRMEYARVLFSSALWTRTPPFLCLRHVVQFCLEFLLHLAHIVLALLPMVLRRVRKDKGEAA